MGLTINVYNFMQKKCELTNSRLGFEKKNHEVNMMNGRLE